MKTFLLISLVSFSALAESNLSDLQYIPEANHSAVQLSGAFANRKSIYEVGGAQQSESNANLKLFTAAGVFGVTSRLSLALSAGYSPSYQLETTFGPASTSNGSKQDTRSSGLIEPAAAVNFRFAEMQSLGVIGDLSVQYSPKIGVSKLASAKVQGNVLRGGDLTTAELTLGQQHETLAYALDLDYSIFGPRRFENAETGIASTENQYSTWSARIRGQMRFNPQFEGRLGVARTSYPTFTNTSASGSTISISSLSTTDLQASVFWNVTPGRMVLAVHFDHQLPAKGSVVDGSTTYDYKIQSSTLALAAMAGF